jgi:hypothetical protein
MEKSKSKLVIFIVIVVLLVAGFGIYMSKVNSGPYKFDTLAQCLGQAGAKFYGAFWCPHCQAQKAAFGSSKRYLPYVECSNADRSQNQVCNDAKIEGYPTWEFADGSRLFGEIPLATLAEKTQCVLPE